MHPSRLIGLLLPALLHRAAANDDCAAARAGLDTWYQDNPASNFADDEAREAEMMRSDVWDDWSIAYNSPRLALTTCSQDNCPDLDDNPYYWFPGKSCDEIQARPEIAASCTAWSGGCAACFDELQALFACAFAGCGVTCPGSSSKKDDDEDEPEVAVLDFVAFLLLGPLALATLAGAACASGRAPYDIVGENLLVVLLAVFNLCGDAAMSILIKRKLNNTMWLVCVGVICAPLGVHVIAILDAWLYRADLSKLTKCNKAVVVLALFFSLPALDGLALALPSPAATAPGDDAPITLATPRFNISIAPSSCLATSTCCSTVGCASQTAETRRRST